MASNWNIKSWAPKDTVQKALASTKAEKAFAISLAGAEPYRGLIFLCNSGADLYAAFNTNAVPNQNTRLVIVAPPEDRPAKQRGRPAAAACSTEQRATSWAAVAPEFRPKEIDGVVHYAVVQAS